MSGQAPPPTRPGKLAREIEYRRHQHPTKYSDDLASRMAVKSVHPKTQQPDRAEFARTSPVHERYTKSTTHGRPPNTRHWSATHRGKPELYLSDNSLGAITKASGDGRPSGSSGRRIRLVKDRERGSRVGASSPGDSRYSNPTKPALNKGPRALPLGAMEGWI